MDKKIAILTNFFEQDPAYSLIRVTENQIKMLLRHDYEPIVIVSESFKPSGVWADERVEIKRVPNVPCHNQVKKDKSFDSDVDAIERALRDHLRGVDVCITQDIVYKPSELKYNFAARRVAKDFDNIRWLHWINSATPPITLNSLMNVFTDQYLELVKTKFPNSFYVFFNDISKEIIAKNFNVTTREVKTVHHPSDLDKIYGVESETLKSFIRKRDIYSADAICVYPARLDRGKQVEFAIKTMAMMKEFDKTVRMIVVDFHSTGGDKVDYRDELKSLGIDWGLSPYELAFTSEFSENWKIRVPHEDVLALFRMSNVFVMPSVSESYSLITQEAALTKNAIVLNQDFPPFRDIFGKNAIFRKYSSNWDIFAGYNEAMGEGRNTGTEYGPDKISKEERKTHERIYHKNTAGLLLFELQNDKSLAMQREIRQKRNLDYVFKNELEPLFYT